MTKVKVCGITRLEDAELAVALGAWALGLHPVAAVQALRRPRRGGRDRARDAAPRSSSSACSSTSRWTRSRRSSTRSGSRYVQLHGDEGPSFCQAVAQRTGAKVIKAVRIGHASDLQDLERFHTDLHLLDTAAAGKYGGTGRTWDWSLRGAAAREDPVPALRRADAGERRRGDRRRAAVGRRRRLGRRGVARASRTPRSSRPSSPPSKARIVA